MYKNNKGITLVALIVTIVVMLILVTVSIQLVINSGIFETAKNASKGTQDKAREEASLGSEIVVDGKTYESAEDYVAGNVKVGPGQRAKKNSNYKSDGKTAVIPEGFTVSGVPTESSIDGGLVIYLIDKKDDGTAWTDEEIAAIDWANGTTVANLQKKYDQFVWIPIKNTTDANAQDINDMYICQNKGTGSYGTGACTITVINEKATCTVHGNCTNMAGRLYATSTGENFDKGNYTEVYTANSGLREPDVVTGSSGTSYDNNTTYLGHLNGIIGTSFYPTTDTTNNKVTATTDFKTYLQEEYNEIVKSVYENQGFYVGRYETSNITTTNGAAIKVVAGSDNTINAKISGITWYYMYAQQKDYATNKGLTKVGSTMIQGAAYDQVMKFVNDTTKYNVQSKGYVAHGSSEGISGVYQTGGLNYPAGATKPYKDVSKNIYDLEGNVSAWTTEAFGTDIRVGRGGAYYDSFSASYRNTYFPDNSYDGIGSVPQLYVK